MSKRLLGLILLGAMIFSLCSCGEKKEDVAQESNVVQDSSVQEEVKPEITQNEESEEQKPQNEENPESEVTNENSGTSTLVGRTYKKEDGTTLEILSSDSEGYINAIKLNSIEINLSNIQLVEGHYGPEENTYLGEFNSGLDQIGISYFTTDDSKLIIRFFGGTASDSTLTREIEVDVTQDGAYYLE